MKINRKFLFRLLAKIQYGKITLHDAGRSYDFIGSQQSTALQADITVHSERLYNDFVLRGSIGAAESYMRGDWDTNNLVSLIEIIIKNQKILERIEPGMAKLANFAVSIYQFFRIRTIKLAKKHIIAHYDLGNAFFKLFLDSTMMYSCALYDNDNISLEVASQKKLEEVCQRLQLSANDHVLEIGSGWGGFAIYAATHYGCKITTTTISDQQFQFLKNTIHVAGLTDKIEVINKDYRLLSGKYDKVVSIEMIEAVGHKHFDLFFETCNRLLVTGGLFFLQCITINDQNYHRAKHEIDFIRKYIFPGGCLPSVASISHSIATKTQLRLLHFRDIGQHYVLTLKDWLEAFNQNLEEVRAQGFSESFIRMWQYYLCYCMASFKQSYTSDVHMMWIKQ